jgi:hypothetical protein
MNITHHIPQENRRLREDNKRYRRLLSSSETEVVEKGRTKSPPESQTSSNPKPVKGRATVPQGGYQADDGKGAGVSRAGDQSNLSLYAEAAEIRKEFRATHADVVHRFWFWSRLSFFLLNDTCGIVS